jgi:hypothetical protein
VTRGVRDGLGVKARVDEDPLRAGLDDVGGDRDALRPLEVVALAPDPRRGGEPADVERLDLQGLAERFASGL